MANTLTLTAAVKFQLDGQALPYELLRINGQQESVTSNLMAGGIQNIGTSAENLNFGEVSTPGYAVFVNLDDTNFVELGWDDTGFVGAVKILKGQFAIIPLNPSRTWQAKADTAACDLYYRVVGV